MIGAGYLIFLGLKQLLAASKTDAAILPDSLVAMQPSQPGLPSAMASSPRRSIPRPPCSSSLCCRNSSAWNAGPLAPRLILMG